MNERYRTIVADPPWEYDDGFAFKSGDEFRLQELPYDSPPYLEMFSRRARLGWDTWGNESLEHVEIEAAQGAA